MTAVGGLVQAVRPDAVGRRQEVVGTALVDMAALEAGAAVAEPHPGSVSTTPSSSTIRSIRTRARMPAVGCPADGPVSVADDRGHAEFGLDLRRSAPARQARHQADHDAGRRPGSPIGTSMASGASSACSAFSVGAPMKAACANFSTAASVNRLDRSWRRACRAPSGRRSNARLEDHPLRGEAVQRRDAGERQAGEEEDAEGDRHA